MKLRLGLTQNDYLLNQYHVVAAEWFGAVSLKATRESDGILYSPAAIIDYANGRFALTRESSGDIAAASIPDLVKMNSAQLTDMNSVNRASSIIAMGQDGDFYAVGVNEPAWDWSTGERRLLHDIASTNYWKNNKFENVTLGGVGVANVPNLIFAAGSGGNYELLATGTDKGLPYIEVRFWGTNSSGVDTYPGIHMPVADYPAGASGEYWTASCFLALVAGSLAGVSALNISVREHDGATYLDASNNNIGGLINSTLNKYQSNRLFNNPSTTNAVKYIFAVVADGVSWDFTLRIASPQLEQQQYGTSAILTNEGVAASRAADIWSLSAKINELIKRGEFTLVVEYDAINDPDAAADNFRKVFSTSVGSFQQLALFGSHTTANIAPYAAVGDGTTINYMTKPGALSLSAGDNVRKCLSISGSEAVLAVNGLAANNSPRNGWDNSTASSLLANMFSSIGGSTGLSVLAKRVMFYPFKIAAAEAARLSS